MVSCRIRPKSGNKIMQEMELCINDGVGGATFFLFNSSVNELLS